MDYISLSLFLLLTSNVGNCEEGSKSGHQSPSPQLSCRACCRVQSWRSWFRT